MRSLTTILLIATILYGCKEEGQLSFRAKIDRIDSIVVDLTVANDLHDIDEFNNIYHHPEVYLDSAKKYLHDNNDEEKKLIVIFAMRRLRLDKYISFIRFCTELYQNDKITENLLEQTIFSEFDDYDYRIIKNYDNQEVKNALRSIRNLKNIEPNFRNNLDHVISGKANEQRPSFFDILLDGPR